MRDDGSYGDSHIGNDATREEALFKVCLGTVSSILALVFPKNPSLNHLTHMLMNLFLRVSLPGFSALLMFGCCALLSCSCLCLCKTCYWGPVPKPGASAQTWSARGIWKTPVQEICLELCCLCFPGDLRGLLGRAESLMSWSLRKACRGKTSSFLQSEQRKASAVPSGAKIEG